MDTFKPDKYDYRVLTKDAVYRAMSDVRAVCSDGPYLEYSPPSVTLSDTPSTLWRDYSGTDSSIWGSWLGDYDVRPWRQDVITHYREEEKPEMAYEEYMESDAKYHDKHVSVKCNNMSDLSAERILKNLAIMKSELMMKCLPYKVDRIECEMTPTVKHNLTAAWKRLAMYGKEAPFVYCFDEYFRPIGEECRIDTLRGMVVKIVDPNDYGEYHLKFKGVIRDIDMK